MSNKQNQNENRPDTRNGGVTWFARFVEQRYDVENYEGPFSDIHELHAAEWGFRVGLTAAFASESTVLAGVVGSLSAAKAGKDVVADGRPAFVTRNASYATLFAFVGYLVGLGGLTAMRYVPGNVA